MKQIFDGIFQEDRKLYTLNSAPQQQLFDEELLVVDGKEYRGWNPLRSKLAAAIVKGL